jgi:hypothetical protein
MGPVRPPHRRTGPEDQLERDLDEVLDRLPPDRVEPDRVPPERLLPERDDFALLELDRDPLAREPLDLLELDLLEPDRDALARERDEDDPLDLRDAEARLPDPLFDLLDEPLRDLLDELLRELVELRELLDERRELERRRELPPLRRSAAGISSRATAFASCSICFARNFAIRSSSRRMERASFAVSLSPTVSASDSIPA